MTRLDDDRRGSTFMFRDVGPYILPFAVQAVIVALLRPLQHTPVPFVLVLGTLVLSVCAGVLCFENYARQPAAIRWLYPPLMLLCLVIFSMLIAGVFGYTV
jgi:hypothetical protein